MVVTVKLEVRPGFFVVLNNVYYIPSMRRNLVSVSTLVKEQYCFLIDSVGIKISHDS